jgi:hypothetical protein
MKNKILLRTLAGSVAISMVFSACQSGNKPVNDKAVTDSLNKKAVINNAPDVPDSDNIILPSPLQIGSIFKNSGLSYTSGITNSVKDVSQYTSVYAEALNTGIYGADLSYCVLNKQTQDALNYLKVVRSLSDKLGFGSVFEENSLAKRFEANLNSEDSLATIIADIQMETDTYLSTNRQKYVGIIAFAGAWVESMYIGAKVVGDKKNDNVSTRISEQMVILSNLVKSLNCYQNRDSHIADLVSSLKKIEDSYMSYDEVKKNMGNDDNVTKLSAPHIDEIAKQIADLRQKFIS